MSRLHIACRSSGHAPQEIRFQRHDLQSVVGVHAVSQAISPAHHDCRRNKSPFAGRYCQASPASHGILSEHQPQGQKGRANHDVVVPKGQPGMKRLKVPLPNPPALCACGLAGRSTRLRPRNRHHQPKPYHWTLGWQIGRWLPRYSSSLGKCSGPQLAAPPPLVQLVPGPLATSWLAPIQHETIKSRKRLSTHSMARVILLHSPCAWILATFLRKASTSCLLRHLSSECGPAQGGLAGAKAAQGRACEASAGPARSSAPKQTNTSACNHECVVVEVVVELAMHGTVDCPSRRTICRMQPSWAKLQP